MAKLSILAGATSQSVNVFIQDSSSTVGAGLSGLVFNTSGLIAYYSFTGANAASVQISLATLATLATAFASGGFKEIDATNMKGLYRLDLPNTALATSKGRVVTVILSGAANMAPCVLEIELTGIDNQDGVRAGMTALPNTVVSTNASLLTSGTGTDQLSVASGRIDIGKALGNAITTTASGIPDVNAKNHGGTAQTGRDIGASVLLSSGTGTGQLSITSGVVQANLAQILGTALTETAGQIAAAFKKFFNIASPTSTMNEITLVDTTTAAGSVTGAVGSVTGAVGSVTGNVGGNVVGSVASVAGAVGSVTGNVGGHVTGSVGSVADAGASLTSIGDTRMAHLDANVSSVGGASFSSLMTSAITESYAAKGAALTLGQFVYNVHQFLYERGASGTTETIKKRDQTTTAKTATLDSTTPTRISEAT